MGNKYAAILQITRRQRDRRLNQQIQKINERVQSLKLNEQRAKQIANLTVTQIVQKLNSFDLTSQELLTSLAWRTVTIGKELNLFTYLYFDEAMVIAQKCDQQRKSTKKKNLTLKDMENLDKKQWQNYFPLLYGVPISIKDVYHLQGKQATIGLLCNAGKKHEQSQLILCFRNAGMIPFVQTNVPQFGMTFEAANVLWGRSLNPWNKLRTTGGSSGGQGGMISSRCSVLGVGSDIGGSIRIPSQFCGVFGLKPNSKRIANSYHAILSKSFQSFAKIIPNNIGPLAKSAQDLALFMSTTTTEQFYKNKHDPYIKIVPFDAKAFNQARGSSKKYRIGYMKSLKDIEPSTASTRAINQTLQILRSQGHQLIQVQIPRQQQIIQQFNSEYLSCGCKDYKKMLEGEKPVKQYQTLFLMGGLRAPGRFVLSSLFKWIMPRMHFYFFAKKPFSSVMQYQNHIGQIQQLRKQWINYWRQKELDLMIAPGFGCQAVLHTQTQKVGLVAAYTCIWNVLDMCSAAMPVTRVREDQQVYQSRFQDIITKQLKKNASGSAGMPVGVQILGLPYDEQKVLGIMSFLEKKIRFYQKQGLPPVS